MKTWIVTAFAAAAIVFAGAMPASAHAYIVDATPAAGATLANPPATVTIQFDEPVNLPDGPAIVVRDAAGRRVDKNDAAIDPNDATAVVAHLTVLARGLYQVQWRVISADTHVVHGTYAFGFGSAPAGSAPAEDTFYDPSSALASVLRWLALAGLLAAAGAVSFNVLLRAGDPAAFAGAATWQTRGGCLLALFATAALFIVQSAASAGSLSAGTSASALAGTLHSPFGIFALVRVLAVVVIFLLSLSPTALAQAVSALAAAAALAALSLSGHATSVPAYGTHATLELADWLHLLSTSAWIGGLGVLAAGLARAHADLVDRERRAWLARFTRLALPCALLTILTGAYATLAHEPHLVLLLSTHWGVVLAIKVALVLLLLALGARHLRAGRGALRFGSATLFAEIVVAIAILFTTGVLVGQSPPACMFMPPGTTMPANMAMPPGMQMC